MKKDDGLLNELVEIKPRRPTVTEEEMELYQSEAAVLNSGVVDLLVKKGIINSTDVAHAKARQFGMEFVNLKTEGLEKGTLALITTDLAHQYRVFAIRKTNNTIRVATADPSNMDALDTLCHALGSIEIEIVVATEEDIDEAIRTYYPLPCDGDIEDVR